MIEDCDRKMAGMIFETAEEYDQYIYVKCMKRSLEGVCLYARRMADLAGSMAAGEADEGWKGQLYRWSISAAGFRNIRPALSGKRFRCTGLFFLRWPALIQLLEWGRLDQLFYPYYKKDKAEGRITDEDVLELFELLRIKDYHLGTVQSKDNRDQTNGRLNGTILLSAV